MKQYRNIHNYKYFAYHMPILWFLPTFWGVMPTICLLLFDQKKDGLRRHL